MEPTFWIVMGLLAIVAIASIHLGYKWGRHVEYNVWTKDFIEKFKEHYFEQLTIAFEKKVEERSAEMVADMFDRYKEKFNEMPNGEEFVELFQSIHDEIEKEINNEDTHSS